MKKYLLWTLLPVLALLLTANRLSATHLMGGELTYVYDGPIPGGHLYTVQLIVYRYCDNSNGNPAALDAALPLGIYINGPSGQLDWYATETLSLTFSTFVTATQGNANCNFQTTACIERGEYSLSIFLSDTLPGYHLMVERCCRNGNIINLDAPGSAGMTFYAFVQPAHQNSSPQISGLTAPYVCASDTVTVVNNAYDPDGDSLVYSFVVPYNGYSSAADPMPDPQFSNNPYLLPIPNVVYAAGFSPLLPFGAGGDAYIDSQSGLTRYFFPGQGFYVAAIEIREYRNGVLIGATRRDLQFVAIACTPNTTPSYTNTGSGGIYSVVEGQNICFNVNFTDADGDSLYLTAAGPLLDAAIVNPPGVIANASGLGTVSSQFCWTPPCGMSRAAPYQFTVTVKDNGCPEKTMSRVFSVYVTQVSPTQTPTVSIAPDPPGIICQGSQVSFVATGTMQGTAPQYFWYQNGVAVAGSDSVYSPLSLNDGDIITVTLVSNALCLFNDTAYSAPYVVNINPQPAPQVIVTSNPDSVLCPQQICFFNANVFNGGSNPAYQWYINGTQSGGNAPAFTAANPAGTMAVYVVVTPSTGCPPVHSDSIVFNIQPWLTPQISIAASATDSICPGQTVFFNASSNQTGNTPQYQWLLNGNVIGQNSDTLSLTAIPDGGLVTVSVTSSYPCLSPAFASATPLTYHHYTPLKADLTDGPIEICKGLPVTLNMQAEGGKFSSYIYQWSGGNSASSINNFVPPADGYYYATVDDACYDAVTDSVLIALLPLPEAGFSWYPQLPSVFLPEVTFADLSQDATQWYWSFGDGNYSMEKNPVHEYEIYETVEVMQVVTNDFGCTDTSIQSLRIEKIITHYLPNAFTPNGDGINDLFGPVGNLTGGHSMAIFNRWGQQVYVTDRSGFWNGNAEAGIPAPAGTYTYKVTFHDETGQDLLYGVFSLIR